MLRAVGAWPAAAALPAGQDPASLSQHAGAGTLRAALDASAPLAEFVVDERLDRWNDRLQWVEGKVGAARDAAQLLATLPPEQIGPQVLRVSQRLGLDPAAVTEAVADAISQDADVPGRLARRDRLDDLDRGQAVTAPESAAQLARSGFSARLLSVTTPADPGRRLRAGTGSARERQFRWDHGDALIGTRCLVKSLIQAQRWACPGGASIAPDCRSRASEAVRSDGEDQAGFAVGRTVAP